MATLKVQTCVKIIFFRAPKKGMPRLPSLMDERKGELCLPLWPSEHTEDAEEGCHLLYTSDDLKITDRRAKAVQKVVYCTPCSQKVQGWQKNTLSRFRESQTVSSASSLSITYVDARDRGCAKMFLQQWSTGRLIL